MAEEELIIDFNTVTLEKLQKPKRKYTRKQVKPPPICPSPSPTPPPIRQNPQKIIHYYIYHEGKADADTMTYISKLQGILDSKGLGSHIQAVTTNGFETYGMHDLFSSQKPMKEWTQFKPSDQNCVCIKVEDRPNETPEELYKKSLQF